MELKNLQYDYAIGDADVFREFDNSNFISNAKAAVTGKVQSLNLKMKFNYYSGMLGKAISDFAAIDVDIDSISTFVKKFESIDKIDSLNITMKDIGFDDVGVFKPQYITQYVTMVQDVINRVINDDISEPEIMRFISAEFPIKVEKQVVKTSLPYGVSSKDLVAENNSEVKVTGNYIRNNVLPFVANYQNTKNDILSEANSLMDTIQKAEEDVRAMINAIESIKTTQNLPFEKIQKLNQVSYNMIRGVISIISYVSFLMLRKMNNAGSKVIACERLYNDMINIYAVESAEGPSKLTVISTDIPSVKDAMLQGDADAFVDLSKKIYNYHSSLPNAKVIEDSEIYTITEYEDLIADGEKHDKAYDMDVYLNIAKDLISVSTGLDIIGAEGDDFLMIFDDIMEKSGLNMPLSVRFKSDVEAISDVSGYTSPEPDDQLFLRALSDMRAFSYNLSTIARIAGSVQKKIVLLEKRYGENAIKEYTDLVTIKELTNFLTEFLSQYGDFIEDISRRFMSRLTAIGKILTEFETKKDFGEEPENDQAVISDNNDYLEMAYESILQDKEEYQNIYFRALESSYYAEKELALRGVQVVLEADNAQQNQQPGKPNQATDVSVIDKSQPNAQSTSQQLNSTALSQLKADINAFITNMIKRFNDIFSKSNASNAKWMALNRDNLTGRSYSNVALNILPYNAMSPENILSDIDKVRAVVRSMTPQNLQNIDSKKTLYTKLFPNIKSINVEDNSTSINDAIKNYYKVGEQQLKVKPISNGTLKSFVTETMIPYFDKYYGVMNKNMAQNTRLTQKVQPGEYVTKANSLLNELGKELDDKIKSYGGTEVTVTESVSIFTEADDVAGNKNTETNIKEKANWLREAIKIYSGSVLNAMRDRAQDYKNALSKLVPTNATAKPAANNNNQTQQNNNNQNTAV